MADLDLEGNAVASPASEAAVDNRSLGTGILTACLVHSG
jgi:hypothetical protein